MKKPLTILPEHFEDIAIQTAGDLINLRLVASDEETFNKVVALVEKRLRFQHHLHLTWEPGDEETSRRIRMDGGGPETQQKADSWGAPCKSCSAEVGEPCRVYNGSRKGAVAVQAHVGRWLASQAALNSTKEEE